AFHTGVVAAVAAEHAVDHQEHQIGVEGEERRSAQRLQSNHVRLLGTGRLRSKSEYLRMRRLPTVMSALRRMKLSMAARRRRAKRSLISSSVCMRWRTTRSGEERSYALTPELSSDPCSDGSGSPVTPANRASTSSCESMLW